MKDLDKSVTHKVALGIIETLPKEELNAIVASGISEKLESLVSSYGIKDAIEKAVVEKTKELLATPEYQEKIEACARKALGEAENLFAKAVFRTFARTFGDPSDRYGNNNSDFSRCLNAYMKDVLSTEA